jgi:hypothetical protein
MKAKLLGMCLMAASTLLSQKGGNFAENHCRFVTEHLTQLLSSNSGRVLLIGAGGFTREQLSERYPFVQFDELSLWNKHLWDKIASDRHWIGLFDCVVALNILEREAHRDKIIQFVSELLTPEGKVLMYVDPKDKEAFDQKIEHYVVNSKWKGWIPIIPSLSIPEYKQLIENAGFHILDQASAEYKIYFKDSFYAFFCLCEFACSRWPIPRTEWYEEQFAGDVRDLLNTRFEVIEVPNARPIFNNWIEDVLPTYYFKFKKNN